jgi:hypothetical protein
MVLASGEDILDQQSSSKPHTASENSRVYELAVKGKTPDGLPVSYVVSDLAEFEILVNSEPLVRVTSEVE